MTPEEIRTRVDGVESRVLPDGQINARHVALESTLRGRHGHAGFIAALDGPGRFRPDPAVPPDTDGLVRGGGGPVILDGAGSENRATRSAGENELRGVTGGNAPVGGNDGNGGVVPAPVPAFVCPRCGAASAHPVDAQAGYCGACHDWTGERGGAMGPTCAADDDRYPEGAVHQSCANARVFEEGGGWLFLGRTVTLEQMPG